MIGIYRVGCETYDRFWLVSAGDKREAVKLVKELTVELGWHLEYPKEKRTWEVERMFAKSGEIVETRDI